MAKKKSTSKAVSHWHRHHSVKKHLIERPLLTLSVLAIIALLFVVIYLTLFVKFKYEVVIETNTESAATILQNK